MKKKKGWCFEKAVVFALAVVLVVSFVALAAYATDGEEARMTTGPQIIKRATPAIATEPIHNPAGSQMFVAGLTTVPTCDGFIDPTEWADAYMYDISDTTGQSDGAPDPMGSVILWLKQDDNGVYFAIRNNVDQTLDDYDQCGLYFDDNYDGCFPASPTNEGNNWLVWSVTGPFVEWRYIQDVDCSFPPTYSCQADNDGGSMVWAPSCFGIGIGPTGVVDYEVMIPYGALDELLDLAMPPDSLGFFVYCSDAGNGLFQGEWPNQGYLDTWREPCYYGRLICEGEEEWPDHKMHFPQLPDEDGWDVNATQPLVLADDWQCSDSGWVKDIHFWGSWKHGIEGQIIGFWLSIHSNIPGPPYSMPGETLWELYVEDFGFTPIDPPTMEGWFDPSTGEVIPNDHQAYFQYNIFLDEPDWFWQDQDVIYWLNISAIVADPVGTQWGWKSSENHFMDDAVWAYWGELDWVKMYEPGTSPGPVINQFFIEFGPDGMPIMAGGTDYYDDGTSFNGWYYYWMTNWWNIWFYNDPFDFERYKDVFVHFVWYPTDAQYWIEVALNWATPDWPPGGPPPLPDDQPEEMFIWREYIPLMEPGMPVDFLYTIGQYNPEWVSMDVMGANVVIPEGIIEHQCLPAEDTVSLDLAFVITGGPPCEPSVEAFKYVWDEEQQLWIELVDLDVGETAEFLVQIHNDGTCCDLTNIDVYDFMDESLEFLSADPPPDLVQPVPGGTELTWSFPGPLAPCNWITITIDARVLGPVCHTDSNYVFVEAYCETADEFVTDEDAAYVHATEPPWPNHKMHYPQLPDPEGWDIVATQGYDMHPGIVAADDFMCMKSGPITDIHIWGSWLWDMEIPILGFWLSIHDNIPGPPYSMPGHELWSTYITDFEVTLEGAGSQGWYDPYADWWEHPNHQMYYRYDIDSIPVPFVQDSGTIYWLNVMAD
ncbi:MAG: hypothetical protein WBC88_05545, partial [Candidatus Zixiibacteriota bacterium]